MWLVIWSKVQSSWIAIAKSMCVCVCLSLSQMVREFSSAQVLILLYVDKKGDQERVVPYVFCN